MDSDGSRLEDLLERLPHMSGPEMLAAYADVLARLDECLAECLGHVVIGNDEADELNRLAEDLRITADRLRSCDSAQGSPRDANPRASEREDFRFSNN